MRISKLLLLLPVFVWLVACNTATPQPPPNPNFTSWEDHPISQMASQGKAASVVMILGEDALPAPYSYGGGVLTVSGYMYRIGTDDNKLSVTMPDQTTWSDNDMYTNTTPAFQGRLDGLFNFSVKLTELGKLELIIYSP